MTEHWIVVGAGAAGCVAAARLSEGGRRRVTLLEDGPDLVAGRVPSSIDGANFLDALAEPGRTHEHLVATRHEGIAATTYLRGRGVGGSSAVNAMIALRGDPEQYRSWGWHDAPSAWGAVAIPSEAPTAAELGPLDRALLAADVRAEVASLTRRGGRRVTAAEAYLWPASDRPQLLVQPDSGVERVILDGRRAVGVHLYDGRRVDADRVVLAAGAIHSPAILLRSGVDTPGVGAGLQDHPSAPLTLRLRAGVEQDRRGLVHGSFLFDGDIQLLPMNHLGSEDAVNGLALLMVALMRPSGRSGQVSLSADPAQRDPDVAFDLLRGERDLAAMVRGVRVAIATLGHPAFTEIVDEVSIDDVGTPLSTLTDDESIAGWLRSTSGGYVHASGTCAMGVVVDQHGAVNGYEALAVCDASVFPAIPAVNTYLPTVMLAERLCARWV